MHYRPLNIGWQNSMFKQLRQRANNSRRFQWSISILTAYERFERKNSDGFVRGKTNGPKTKQSAFRKPQNSPQPAYLNRSCGNVRKHPSPNLRYDTAKSCQRLKIPNNPIERRVHRLTGNATPQAEDPVTGIGFDSASKNPSSKQAS